jgi:hypothetical protein
MVQGCPSQCFTNDSVVGRDVFQFACIWTKELVPLKRNLCALVVERTKNVRGNMHAPPAGSRAGNKALVPSNLGSLTHGPLASSRDNVFNSFLQISYSIDKKDT